MHEFTSSESDQPRSVTNKKRRLNRHRVLPPPTPSGTNRVDNDEYGPPAADVRESPIGLLPPQRAPLQFEDDENDGFFDVSLSWWIY
jgi:hypothetical protein